MVCPIDLLPRPLVYQHNQYCVPPVSCLPCIQTSFSSSGDRLIHRQGQGCVRPPGFLWKAELRVNPTGVLRNGNVQKEEKDTDDFPPSPFLLSSPPTQQGRSCSLAPVFSSSSSWEPLEAGDAKRRILSTLHFWGPSGGEKKTNSWTHCSLEILTMQNSLVLPWSHCLQQTSSNEYLWRRFWRLSGPQSVT